MVSEGAERHRMRPDRTGLKVSAKVWIWAVQNPQERGNTSSHGKHEKSNNKARSQAAEVEIVGGGQAGGLHLANRIHHAPSRAEQE